MKDKIRLVHYEKAMKVYFKYKIDKKEGETFSTWFSFVVRDLEDEGKVTAEGKYAYVYR